jgi:hypothetical protein
MSNPSWSTPLHFKFGNSTIAWATALLLLCTFSTHAAEACAKTPASWATCDNWALQNYRGGKYFVRNNIWGQANPGGGQQCIWANSEHCWGITATHKNATGLVKGYPHIVRGWATGDGFKNANHGLGIRVTDLTKARLHWKMKAPTGGRYQALWDIYFHSKANPGGGDKAQTSLMINQRLADDGYYAGELTHCPQNNGVCPPITLGGQNFRLWIGKSEWSTGNTIQLHKLPVEGRVWGSEDMTLDLKVVIDGLRKLRLIPDDVYLTSIQAGWEIIEGGTFETLEFWTAVQDDPEQ